MEIYCTCNVDIPSKQFKAKLALPGNVSGLARRNKIAMEDTVVVPCNEKNEELSDPALASNILLSVFTQCGRQGYHATVRREENFA